MTFPVNDVAAGNCVDARESRAFVNEVGAKVDTKVNLMIITVCLIGIAYLT